MPTEVLMPQLGESVTEGTVVHWLKQPGEHVALDESLAEIETEKVNAEIPSPFEGTLVGLLVNEGDTVDVGTPIAAIEEASGSTPASVSSPAAVVNPVEPVAAQPTGATGAIQGAFSASGPLGPQPLGHGMFSTGEASSADGESAESSRAEPLAEAAAFRTGATAAAPVLQASQESGRYSPAVLRLAEEHAVDLARLSGTGAGGRITRKDVQTWIERNGQSESQAAATKSDATAAPERAWVSGAEEPQRQIGDSPATLDSGDLLEPLSPTRRAIARHMTESVRTIPHAWMMVEVDVSRLVALRESVKRDFSHREGVELTYLPFVINACVQALREHPRINSSWREEGIVLHRRVNVGVAVNTEYGLLVPVIHDAGDFAISGLAHRVVDLAARARSRSLTLAEIQGGTFTVDNTGAIGSVASQPIINSPQCAIVTMESIVRRPVVVGDGIAVRSMMNCCISFDHRIVDGGDVGPFMHTLKAALEDYGPGLSV